MKVFLWKICRLTPGPLTTDHGPGATEEKLETADLKEGVKTAKPMDRR